MHIIIDPGHGGRDPGAQGWVIPERTFPPTLEKDLTLLYALDLEKELIARGHQVTLTRRTDKYVSLQDRANLTQTIRLPPADCFISLHFDACQYPKVRGTSALYNNWGNQSSRLGKPLAEALVTEVVKSAGTMNRGVFPRPSYKLNDQGELVIAESQIYVLRHAKVWAALLEIGFLSNYEEEKLLVSPEFRRLVVEGIANGIEKWGREYLK
jgi:N-acetylmuramoyl-L-alanine amidase